MGENNKMEDQKLNLDVSSTRHNNGPDRPLHEAKMRRHVGRPKKGFNLNPLDETLLTFYYGFSLKGQRFLSEPSLLVDYILQHPPAGIKPHSREALAKRLYRLLSQIPECECPMIDGTVIVTRARHGKFAQHIAQAESTDK